MVIPSALPGYTDSSPTPVQVTPGGATVFIVDVGGFPEASRARPSQRAEERRLLSAIGAARVFMPFYFQAPDPEPAVRLARCAAALVCTGEADEARPHKAQDSVHMTACPCA